MSLSNDEYFSPLAQSFLKSLGFPNVKVHHSANHFDFRIPGRRILVIGPMGSGKTEYSAKVWRDSQVLQKKSELVLQQTSEGETDRRKVFFVRFGIDAARFPDYPQDALAYRSGFERLGSRLAMNEDSFGLEKLFQNNPEIGTWIVDEASFYEERLAYVVKKYSQEKKANFIFPALVLNFRKEIFNATARLLLETATDVFPLTAYCEHPDCVEDSFYTYRWYEIDGQECPAPFFDPLIIIGGDRKSKDPWEPNYCTRCDAHHYLPGKEYTYLTLKPLGQQSALGNGEALFQELKLLKLNPEKSLFAQSLQDQEEVSRASLKVPFLAERALIYLFTECNLLTEDKIADLVGELSLDRPFLIKRLSDNGFKSNFLILKETSL